jgi:tagatose-1,6-bisphosphate aldolase
METIREYWACDDEPMAEVEAAVKVEAELNALVSERLTELVTSPLAFAMPYIRKHKRNATVAYVLRRALLIGLDGVIDELEAKVKPTTTNRKWVARKAKKRSGSTLK